MLKQANIVFLIVMLLFPVGVFAANPATIFVFDGSGSMWLEIEGTPKIELAKKAMEEMLKDFPAGVDIGLVSYGHRVIGDCDDIELLAPLGSSRADVIKAVASIVDPRGNTPLAQSIKFAAEQLKGRDSSSSIIVISDGKESCNADPCKVVAAITATGIDLKVHVVGFDVKQDEAEQLRCIAGNGGGKYFAANNAGELANSFAELKKEVVEVEKPQPTAKVIFRDDFDDEFLSDQWEIKNPDEDNMIVEEGFLQILTDVSKESFFNPTNFVLLKQELRGQYEIILRMKYTRSDSPSSWGQAQTAGLILFKDKQNAMVLAASNWGGYFDNSGHDAIHFAKMKKKEWMPDFKADLGGAEEDREITLRLQRIKKKFIASYLDPKGKWKVVGDFTQLRAKYRIGIYAARGSKAHEGMETFDSFVLKEIK